MTAGWSEISAMAQIPAFGPPLPEDERVARAHLVSVARE
jgi:hypothetical protein